MSELPFDPHIEFDRQVGVLSDLGYAAWFGSEAEGFAEGLEPLRRHVVERANTMTAATKAKAPFAIVVSRTVAPPSETFLLTRYGLNPGFVSTDTADIDLFLPIETVSIPTGSAYVVFDLDRGHETLNATPDEAIAKFAAESRSPLTIDEGIAFITLFADSLEKNNCFQTAASRIGDRRVPGIWISRKAPKLGFCWAGNRHTWLGAASCSDRQGVV